MRRHAFGGLALLCAVACSSGNGGDTTGSGGSTGTSGTSSSGGPATCSVSGSNAIIGALAAGGSRYQVSFTGTTPALNCVNACDSAAPCTNVVGNPITDGGLDLDVLGQAVANELLGNEAVDAGLLTGVTSNVDLASGGCGYSDSFSASPLSGVQTNSALTLTFVDGGATGTELLQVVNLDGGLLLSCGYGVALTF